MKLVNYCLKHPFATSRMGVMTGSQVVDLASAQTELKETGVIAGDTAPIAAAPAVFYTDAALHIKLAAEVYAQLVRYKPKCMFHRSEVKLLTPIPQPSKIICIGTNYADHVKEMGSEMPQYPVLFSKFTNAMIGPEDVIHKSAATEALDYEVELTVVMGKKASKVLKEEALDYVAGYTIGNDVSARDLQKRTPQWLQGKSLDHTTPFGPWMVTKDEIPNPGELKVESFVNGVRRQSSNTKHFIFDIPYLIEFITNLITLEPGDMIMTGTPDGVGFAMNPPKLLEDGDVVTMEIEGIGQLENIVAAKS
ncbi:fumarylacetoacetate hydrolase family protein [Gracilibacillus alcaliphilus]|uniref:fumarylacetoacetate hydrolase family protein n=1 Tax=Gracilibacillus alcaliphilus TaxID=1401441 RepID=UPI00195C9E9B|nr:fumarylacetoacetate hydrolase family protein [Gracilibacillus alcaliphilus]MBM7677090.1 2-keto-4-pentenoate hydratase/2-oxohepta-3-ene-1,7-dioic acid hydratase in catechol pathway [Gracilibacillus alcaliphilus]